MWGTWSIDIYGASVLCCIYDPVQYLLKVTFYNGSFVTLKNQPLQTTNSISNAPDPEAYVLGLIAQSPQ